MRHCIDHEVSQLQENRDTSGRLVTDSFMTAYAKLRRVAPKGNLHIHLTIYDERKDEPTERVFRTGAGK
jgi:hypothetical protein